MSIVEDVTTKPMTKAEEVNPDEVRTQSVTELKESADFYVPTVVRVASESALKPTVSGLWLYQSNPEGLVEAAKAELPTDTHIKTVNFFNDVVAKAYYGCKLWESQRTAKPQDGTGFFKYISPEGTVVFFPCSWLFSECPVAWLLGAPKTEQELGEEISYYNIYSSLADMENSAKCKAYYRIYETGSGKEDLALAAQMVTYSDTRLTYQPEVLSEVLTTKGFHVEASTLTTQSYTPTTNKLANNTPDVVQLIKLASGQVIGRDKKAFESNPKEATTYPKRKGRLPPIFVE